MSVCVLNLKHFFSPYFLKILVICRKKGRNRKCPSKYVERVTRDRGNVWREGGRGLLLPGVRGIASISFQLRKYVWG